MASYPGIIRIAIRDDDTSFFTDPDDLESTYSEIKDFPVSYAVIPFISGFSGDCPEAQGNKGCKDIAGNARLVRYLSELYKEGRADILLHGITHEYKYRGSKKVPEMLWIDDFELGVQLKRAKCHLERTFGAPVSCFVAPSNKITRRAISEIADLGMDFSGIIQHFDRAINLRYLKNYLKRWAIRAFCGIPYPGVLDYGTHREINACRLDSRKYLLKMYSFCKRNGFPMVVNVHYWHLRDNPSIRKWFFGLIKDIISDGAIPSTVSQCIGDNNQ